MFLLNAILTVYFASVFLPVLHTVQFTIDLPAQILVTRIRKACFEIFDLYLIDPLARLRCTESRISDCLETLVLEILQIAWFPEGKCISGNLSGYQSYMEIRNIKSGDRRRRDCKNGCSNEKIYIQFASSILFFNITVSSCNKYLILQNFLFAKHDVSFDRS